MKSDLKIAIIGLGNLGMAIAQELIRSNRFTDIYLENRSKKRLDSIFESLSVFRSIINSPTNIHFLQKKDLKSIGIVVVSIKERYDPRELLKTETLPDGIPKNVRNIGLNQDIPLLFDLMSKLLNGYSGKIITLSNPVDLYTVLIKKWVPRANVFGLGVTLDSARLAYLIEKEYQLNYFDYLEIPVCGAHTSQIIPLKSKWNIEDFIDKNIDELISRVSKIGPEIVKGLGFTLHDCVEVFTRDIIWFSGDKTSRNYICVSYGDSKAATGIPIQLNEDNSVNKISIESKEEICLIEKTREEIEVFVSTIESKILNKLLN